MKSIEEEKENQLVFYNGIVNFSPIDLTNQSVPFPKPKQMFPFNY